MVPGRLFIVDRMPQSASGKVDVAALKQSEAFQLADQERPFVAPRNATEAEVCRIWRDVLGLDTVSVADDFFELGGNSIQAVSIARATNRHFGTSLPVQVIFSASSVEKLSALLGAEGSDAGSRAILLAGQGDARNIFCWPGLGGYPMNLRHLGEAVAGNGRFYGMQSIGINAGEAPFDSIEAMAAEDVRLIRHLQPSGPYELWGYSFGARVAYEVAHQLQRQGEQVRRVVLLAPGSPQLPHAEPVSREASELFSNPAFLTILLSVFAHEIDPALSEQCLASVRSRDEFVAFAAARFPAIDSALLDAIVDVVAVTYSPQYQIALAEKPLSCPVSVWRARGDGTSFVCDGARAGLDIEQHDLAVGHYTVLKPEGIGALLAAGLA
jgi:thioesterase domain-containing protein/acyl carrier protein